MTRIFTVSLSLIFLSLIIANAQEPLPKWLTEEEKEIFQDYLQSFENQNKSTQPPPSPPRTPAEFEEAGGLIITWASYSTELREIVRHASLRVPIYIVASNISQVQNFLTSGNVDLSNISLLQFPFNSVWVRDFGPQSIYLDGTDELAFVDWIYNRPRPNDNLIPQNMSDYLGLSIFQMTSGANSLIATGGNFMTDGHGTAFSSKLILSENANLSEFQIDDIMYAFKGIDRYIKFDELPYDNISHIDMHMKLLDSERILVGEFPQGVSDGPFIEANLDYLLFNYNTVFDRDYEIIRIPMVPSPIGNFSPNAHYRTFTNSLILNDLVLVPTYYNTAMNDQALAIYQDAMPGYEIIGINMEDVIGASGAIHCITREIAAEDPIWISHAFIRDSEGFANGFPIEARIRNVSGITSASVFYRVERQGGFQEIAMSGSGEHFSATIPAQACNVVVEYFISATNANKTIFKPFPGASGPWAFEVSDGEPVDFTADNKVTTTGTPVEFIFTGCLTNDEITSVEWHFGEGAQPATANTIEPESVVYSTAGHKTISLTVNSIEVVKESFILITDEETFTLTVERQGQGQTQPAPGTYHFVQNSEVNLAATPDEGWIFDRWDITGPEAGDNSESEIVLVMNDDRTATAVFKQIETSVSQWQNEFQFAVFPNPSAGKFNIVMSPSATPVNIEVFNINGNLVYSNTISVTQWDQQYAVDFSSKDKGIYLVRVTCEAGTHSNSRRVIVQ